MCGLVIALFLIGKSKDGEVYIVRIICPCAVEHRTKSAVLIRNLQVLR